MSPLKKELTACGQKAETITGLRLVQEAQNLFIDKRIE